MRMGAVMLAGCLAGGLALLLPAAARSADGHEGASSRLVYEVLPLNGAARVVVNEVYTETPTRASDSEWVDVTNLSPRKAQGFLILDLDGRLGLPWLPPRPPASPAVEQIQIEGGKVEINGDTIKIEGGKVSITRQRRP